MSFSIDMWAEAFTELTARGWAEGMVYRDYVRPIGQRAFSLRFTHPEFEGATFVWLLTTGDMHAARSESDVAGILRECRNDLVKELDVRRAVHAGLEMQSI